jgi:hypothetical protein
MGAAIFLDYDPARKADAPDPLWHEKRLAGNTSVSRLYPDHDARPEPQGSGLRIWDAKHGMWRDMPRTIPDISYRRGRALARVPVSSVDGIGFTIRDKVTGHALWYVTARDQTEATELADTLAIQSGFLQRDVYLTVTPSL